MEQLSTVHRNRPRLWNPEQTRHLQVDASDSWERGVRLRSSADASPTSEVIDLFENYFSPSQSLPQSLGVEQQWNTSAVPDRRGQGARHDRTGSTAQEYFNQLSTNESVKDISPIEIDDCNLSFKLVYTDGGEFSTGYSCGNMLRNDTTCYSSTKRAGVNCVATLPDCPYFTITEIQAVAPVEGFTSPLGQAAVFTCWEMPDLSKLSKFDDVCSEEEFSRLANLLNQGPRQAVPIAFLDLGEKRQARVHLKIPRSGRFVLIKLLRPVPGGENVDVQYIGFHGWSSPHAFASGCLL